ncbi:D-Tyr tRNAtyr deacylase-like domain-containing protein [Baffinella frigidus]|nr:D-Tyr tRNAtyr deacylase-like domain-containing protein [Cryptophyta sp. CCMP2293]
MGGGKLLLLFACLLVPASSVGGSLPNLESRLEHRATGGGQAGSAAGVLRLRGGMRCVVQRVTSASVTVDGEVVAKIGPGLCVLVGLSVGDAETPEVSAWMAKKLLGLKFFGDEDQGKMWKKNLKDVDGELLLVSQFTLYYRYKGTNLDFSKAMAPDAARVAFDDFVATCRKEHGDESKVQTGVFGAMMEVALVNDGPVTMNIEYPEPDGQKKS